MREQMQCDSVDAQAKIEVKFEVKNTFIHLTDARDDKHFFCGNAWKRQTSEPLPRVPRHTTLLDSSPLEQEMSCEHEQSSCEVFCQSSGEAGFSPCIQQTSCWMQENIQPAQQCSGNKEDAEIEFSFLRQETDYGWPNWYASDDGCIVTNQAIFTDSSGGVAASQYQMSPPFWPIEENISPFIIDSSVDNRNDQLLETSALYASSFNSTSPMGDGNDDHDKVHNLDLADANANSHHMHFLCQLNQISHAPLDANNIGVPLSSIEKQQDMHGDTPKHRTVRFCPNCGRKIFQHFKFCENCGLHVSGIL